MSDRFDKAVSNTAKVFNGVASVAIVGATFLVVLNILLREIFGSPILGTYEYVGIVTAVIVCFAIAYTLVVDAHIAVDFLVEKLATRTQRIIDAVTNIFVFGFLALFTYNMFDYATQLLKSNAVSPTTQFPIYIIVYLVALCFVVLCFVMITKIKQYIREAAKK